MNHLVATLVFSIFPQYFTLECITNNTNHRGTCFCFSFDADMDKFMAPLCRFKSYPPSALFSFAAATEITLDRCVLFFVRRQLWASFRKIWTLSLASADLLSFLFFFFWPHWGIWKFPSQGSNLQLRPTPQLQQWGGSLTRQAPVGTPTIFFLKANAKTMSV